MLQSLLEDLPRGDPERAPFGEPPCAEFVATAKIAAAQDLAFNRSKIFLGAVGANVSGKGANRKALGGQLIGIDDNRHQVTIAGTRSGKGRSAIVPVMLTYGGSVLATDPKGELATITARRRKEMGQQVHVLDPFGECRGNAIPLRKGFNPIRAMRPQRIVEDAALIADALVVIPGETKDPHWDEAAKSFIEGVVLYVGTEPAYKETGSLVTVRLLVSEGEREPDENGFVYPDSKRSFEALKVRMMFNTARKDEEDPVRRKAGAIIRAAAIDFFERPPKERGSVHSTVRRHLKFIDYPEISNIVAHHDFELEELKTEATTIYLCLPARHIGTCSRWLRLFVNMTLQAMEVTRGNSPSGLPVLFCLDEFASLGHMRQIEEAAGLIAGFSVKIWAILQDLGQLKALYEKRWETFLGNAGVIQFFGNNDLTTLEWISRRCDQTYIRTRENSAVTGKESDSGRSGTTWKTEVHNLLTVGEISQFFSRYDPLMRQLIIWAGSSPLIIQRVHYDTHEMFAGLFDEIPQQ